MQEQSNGKATLQLHARVLIVATDDVAGPELLEDLRGHLGDVDATEVMVTSPAVEKSPFRHALGDVDMASMKAGQRLETSLDELNRAGIPAFGEIGDSDPLIAAGDALRQFDADEVLIVAHASDQARWFEEGLFERAQAELEPAVRMVTLRRDEEGPPHLADVEESGPGLDPEPGADHEIELSPNLPRLTRGGLAGILIAIVGTIAVIVLAGTGPSTDSAGGAAQILIAMAVALVNMAHVVGLTLLESVHYRGGWQRFFRNLSLTATPLAIVANALISILS
ncbi:MAG TPA: hypothetical protein VMR96_00975 [Solirubrobacterales bacterium]|nr:hypothetical protein [Solirubrobacterales bacterium]